MEKIVWSKKYEEDLGSKDENGLYDYAYRYFTYWFTLPNNERIRGRRYTDTLENCSLHIALDDLERKSDPRSSQMVAYVSGIINFLLATEGVKKIEYFSQAYKPVDLTTIKDNLKDFSFEEEKV